MLLTPGYPIVCIGCAPPPTPSLSAAPCPERQRQRAGLLGEEHVEMWVPCLDSGRVNEINSLRDRGSVESNFGAVVPVRREQDHDRFHGKYKKEANEYDKVFIKMHDEDLNITLIFVSERFMSHVERI